MQSEKDKNLYHNYFLENGLEVLIVEDRNVKDITKESAFSCLSLCVGVGSFNEDRVRGGMAHFLEHMIFMGSKKYPDENLFSKLITQNGGYTNAYTEWEYTNFYFKIKTSGFLEVADI